MIDMFRAHYIKVPECYIGEARMGSWTEVVDKDKGMQASKEWWEANLAPGWEKNLILEKVED